MWRKDYLIKIDSFQTDELTAQLKKSRVNEGPEKKRKKDNKDAATNVQAIYNKGPQEEKIREQKMPKPVSKTAAVEIDKKRDTTVNQALLVPAKTSKHKK